MPRTIFRFGSPKWCEEGVDREAADYGALEKVGRALLHRQRALFNEVRREGREVMRLLTQAAERTVAPTLQDLLVLATGLMAVLTNLRLARRGRRLNRRVAKLLEAFVQKRYEKAGVMVSAEALYERLMMEPVAGLPPLPQRPRRARPPGSRPQPKSQPEAAESAGIPPAPPVEPYRGPDLPEKGEEFVILVRRAFCASQPEPEDVTIRSLIDDFAGCLWDRLHIFDAELQCETARLNHVLDQMGHTPPDEGPNHVSERCWSIEAELEQTVCRVGTIINMGAEVLPEQLGTLMRLRYGLEPEIERFCRASEELKMSFETANTVNHDYDGY